MRALVLDRTTGEGIRLEQLFSDADAAFDAMETIIENDVLSQLSDYMEYASSCRCRATTTPSTHTD